MYSILAEFMRARETVALATIIRVRGSVPREVGAKMIVHPQGRHHGTVGGGCGESAVMGAAMEVIASGRPTVTSVDLTGEITMESPAICGGTLDVFVERLPGPHFALDDLQPLLDAVERRQRVALATVVAAPGERADLVGRKLLVGPGRDLSGSLGWHDLESVALVDALQALEDRQHSLVCYAHNPLNDENLARSPALSTAREQGQSSHYTQQAYCVFTEVQRRTPSLVIAGGGHVALPLAEIARLCEFTVTVLDDRAQFANTRRFPAADSVIAGPMPESLRQLPLDEDTYVVLITRGHQLDVDCLLQILDAPLRYVGMIGSRRRVRGVITLLEQEKGIQRAKLKRVFAPIGLDIGAKTPAEIALTIMAEVVKVYRGGTVPSLSDDWRLG